MMEDLFIH